MIAPNITTRAATKNSVENFISESTGLKLFKILLFISSAGENIWKNLDILLAADCSIIKINFSKKYEIFLQKFEISANVE